ncbi:50S ribosomal protein L32 [Candidatus Gromoviella agglomerans]|uniref:50S ribosomal protein L32 n=1 Tax=Candidatus Gromoviella agglomerans TaxID=2806609 RepID=UPI001E5A0811|nr:50S ribosomal protein L32 [Candidatus Gromoviella agglomerans]UFX98292.1 50S ribosomal protein L32 [Candidatus Gromoviella agglomerans]
MAVPKKKTSLHKRKLRRGQRTVQLRAHSVCTNCNSDKYPHHVCMSCGFYNGKPFLDIKKDN